MGIRAKIHLTVFMEVKMKKQLRRKYVSFSQKVSYKYILDVSGRQSNPLPNW
jgi:hypothetical protein